MTQADREQAFRLLREGCLEEAYEVFQDIRDKYPDDWVIYDGLAYVEKHLKNNFELAREFIEKARELGCPEARYHRVCADILWSQGRLEEATREFEQAVIADRSLDNLMAFANSLMKTNYERAVPVWKEIVEKEPSNAIAYLGLAWIARKQDNWALALEMATKAKQLQPKDLKALYAMGQAYQGLNQWEHALKYYLDAHEKGFPETLCFHANAANCYAALGNYVKTLEHARQATRLAPRDAAIDGLLDHCKDHLIWLCGDQQYSEAYPIMVVALDIWPDDSILLAYMAVLEMELKHNCEAGKSYMHKAFECASTDLDLLYAIKGCLWFDHLCEQKEALTYLEKAVSLNRNKFNLQSLAFRIIDLDIERARCIYEELFESDPEDINVILGLARIVMKEEKWHEGYELASKAYDLEPSDAGVNALLGYAHFKLERFEESLQCYQEAEKLDFPDKVYIYNSIAECYEKLGRVRKARKYAQKALDIDSSKIS